VLECCLIVSNERPGHEGPAITDRFRRSQPPTSHLSAAQPLGHSPVLRSIHIASLIKSDKKESFRGAYDPRKVVEIAFIGMGPATAEIKEVGFM